jgi:hypothetical protein
MKLFVVSLLVASFLISSCASTKCATCPDHKKNQNDFKKAEQKALRKK